MSVAAPLAIVNARLVLPGESEPVLGALRCVDGHICAVGPDVVAQPGDLTHDAGGKLVAPARPGAQLRGAFAPGLHFRDGA